MEEKVMKCTNAWEVSRMLRHHMKKELKAALVAHGGEFSWYSEEDEGKDEDEKYTDNVPIVMLNHKYAGPVNVKIRRAYIDSYGHIVISAVTNEYDNDIDIELDDIVAHHIQYIIESIPVTDAVSDVSIPFSIGE